MDRSQKTDAVAQLNNVFNEAGVVVVTRNLGLTVAESTDLRAKMREAGATYQVAKNRLAKIALKDTDYAGIDEYLTGPTALAYSEDPVAAAKAVVEFAKTNDRIEVVGGSMGSQVLDEAGVRAPRRPASTNCVASSLAWSTPPRRKSRRSSMPRRTSWPVSSAHMPPRTLRKTFFRTTFPAAA